jgi:hypothetical protein
MQDFDHDPPKVQHYVPSPQKNEGMLPLRPSFETSMNVFKEVWTTHRSLGSSCISSRGQIPRFHTSTFMQGMEAKLDEHRKAATMFQ